MSNKSNISFSFSFVKAVVLSLACMLLMISSSVKVDAAVTLEKNELGQYCINTSEDFYTFLKDIKNREYYDGCEIIINNDLTIEGKVPIAQSFNGSLDGQGHTITYSTTETYSPLFPFRLKGEIKNLKVQLDDCTLYASSASGEGRIFCSSVYGGKLEGIQIDGDVNCVIDAKIGVHFSAFQINSNPVIENCGISLNWNLDNEKSLPESDIIEFYSQRSYIGLFQMGDNQGADAATIKNCYSKATYSKDFESLADKLEKNGFYAGPKTNRNVGISIDFISCKKDGALIENCYYNKEIAPKLLRVNENYKSNKGDYTIDSEDSFGRTTEEMKKQETYIGFNFDKKWSISPEINDGYPYYDLRIEEIILDVKPIVEDKVWNITTSKDENRYGLTNTYYYPYVGDDNATVTGVEFVNLTENTENLIKKYGITISCTPETDVKSAKIDMDYLGQRPVTVEWNSEPTLVIAKQEQAEEDAYEFEINLVEGTGNVLDNGAEGVTKEEWDTYYKKAQEACTLILDYCRNQGAFGTKENPSFENTDVWAIFTGARCGYVPFDDEDYYDNWFKNTKEYLQKLKDENLHGMKNTDRAKLILAIEAIGYDPRDISSVDLLADVGDLADTSLLYQTEYAIHAIKSGGYTSDTFTDEEIEAWVHKRAAGLKDSKDNALKNADNAMGWQPLIYWYGQEGFEDVTEAINAVMPRFAAVAQRATGAFCTEEFETQCPTWGNNAWNNAQALLFAASYGVNVLDQDNGFTKNGNNVLDAVFDQINFEEGTIPGFSNYDPPQIARGLNAVVRQYEQEVLGKDVPGFWIFTDVEVPTREVNDAILALDGNSSDEEIAAAREKYEALDDTHKAIFNQTTYKKLVQSEAADIIEALEKQVNELPKISKVTLEDKGAVETARAAYDAIIEEQKEFVPEEVLEKLQKRENKIAALEVEAIIESLPVELTLENEQAVKDARAAYEALTKAQKRYVLQEDLVKLDDAEEAIVALKEEAGIPIVTVTLNKAELTLKQNVTKTLKATVSNGESVFWSSSEPEVANVDNSGVVTSYKDGTTVITAVTKDGTKATCTVTVDSKLQAKAKPATKSIKLTWKKIADADGYIVYRYNSSTKKYKKIATLSASKTSYTVKKVNGSKGAALKAGTNYTFKVCSYVEENEKKVVKKSEVIKTATKPAKVTISKLAKKSSKKVKITWKKVKGTGYQVWMKTGKNGKYKLVKTVKKSSTTSCTKGSLKKGKTYYFKIRAYKTVNGKTIYGSYSKVKSIKLK